MINDIYEIKLSKESFEVSCYDGALGTTMNFDERDVVKVRNYFARYGIILKNVGSGGQGNNRDDFEHYVVLQFPQFTSMLIKKRYIILAVPNSRGNAIMVKLILKEKPAAFTCDKFGVPLHTDEMGTHTIEECIRRGFNPEICQWLLKPELRDKSDVHPFSSEGAVR